MAQQSFDALGRAPFAEKLLDLFAPRALPIVGASAAHSLFRSNVASLLSQDQAPVIVQWALAVSLLRNRVVVSSKPMSVAPAPLDWRTLPGVSLRFGLVTAVDNNRASPLGAFVWAPEEAHTDSVARMLGESTSLRRIAPVGFSIWARVQ